MLPSGRDHREDMFYGRLRGSEIEIASQALAAEDLSNLMSHSQALRECWEDLREIALQSK